jgi:hypothetical protein
MPSKAEKQRRREIVRGIRDRDHAEAEARMPISKAHLRELFDLLESTLFERRGDTIWCHCDHTFRHSREFLRSRSLPEDTITEWFGEYGGFCDCEVAYNVADYWSKHVGYQ